MFACLGRSSTSNSNKALAMTSNTDSVDILMLGAGWTSTFLIPLLREEGVSYASTTRDGRDGSLKFGFDPKDETPSEDFKKLPDAKAIVVVFPIYESGGSKKLVDWYRQSHPSLQNTEIRWIQLGSTGIWDGGRTLAEDVKVLKSPFIDRKSPYDPTNARANAEKELLNLHSPKEAHNTIAILNLCGLYGGGRSIRRYVGRIAGTKEMLREKNSIHMIHGIDVARAIYATAKGSSHMMGERWLLTDLRVYDWYDLASKWGTAGEDGRGKPMEGPQADWVLELMHEQGIRALPRTPEQLGKALDSREFWQTAGISPIMGGQLD